jgi:hypothetical protein
MGETRRKFDRDFREGAVRLVRETGKPIAQVARRTSCRSISGRPAALASFLNRRVIVSGCGGLPFSQQNSQPSSW